MEPIEMPYRSASDVQLESAVDHSGDLFDIDESFSRMISDETTTDSVNQKYQFNFNKGEPLKTESDSSQVDWKHISRTGPERDPSKDKNHIKNFEIKQLINNREGQRVKVEPVLAMVDEFNRSVRCSVFSTSRLSAANTESTDETFFRFSSSYLMRQSMGANSNFFGSMVKSNASFANDDCGDLNERSSSLLDI